ncbi:hemoglobin [Zavarzinia compransoris]|uniref:Hemoglobin n=2 Tax=Zavarzinia compransoris TaxID=1264899 RepID=A0A317DYY4_9PROT|nr:hemoglobin [Zavarzinia compransoris]TDP44966.1 hemoglobin [Zavarzinia compransoris]
MEASLPHELSEPLVEQLVHAFYARVRADAALGPIFEARLAGRWDAHLGKMVDFWSSIALKSGRYVGQPHVAHQSLGLAPEHFERWLGLFEETVATVCTGPAAAFFIDRAHRIADSLQIGLNIGPKALQIPTTSPIPA